MRPMHRILFALLLVALLAYWTVPDALRRAFAPRAASARCELRGSWNRVHNPPRDAAAAIDPDEMDRLAMLGYTDTTGKRPDNTRGVVYCDRHAACPGVSFYVSGHAPEVTLIDLAGNVLHRWSRSFVDTWPEIDAEPDDIHTQVWCRAQLLPSGDLITMFATFGLVRLDRNSNVVWKLRGRFHHDIEYGPDGRTYVLDRLGRHLPHLHADEPIIDDGIVIVAPTGKILRRVSIIDAFENSDYAAVLRGRRHPHGDILHTNTVELVDPRLAARVPTVEPGDILISCRNLDLIAVVDLDAERVVWALSGMWFEQHCPTVVADGHILLFDNRGHEPHSRVIEINPLTQAIRWTFGGTPNEAFYSRTYGTTQRLPNGNTLVVESCGGRALEVTPAGRVAWEFRNPHVAGDNDEFVAMLFELERVPADSPNLAWLATTEP